MIEPVIIAVLALPLATAFGALVARTPRQADAINIAGALATAGGALGLAIAGIARADEPAAAAGTCLTPAAACSSR